MLRTINPSTGALPFQSLMVADLGDVNVNLYNLPDSCRLIQEAYEKIMAAGCVPLTLGNGICKGKGSALAVLGGDLPCSPTQLLLQGKPCGMWGQWRRAHY